VPCRLGAQDDQLSVAVQARTGRPVRRTGLSHRTLRALARRPMSCSRPAPTWYGRYPALPKWAHPHSAAVRHGRM